MAPHWCRSVRPPALCCLLMGFSVSDSCEGGETCQDYGFCFTWHRPILKRDSPTQAKFPTRGAFYWPSVARVHLLHCDPLGCGTVVRAETSLRGWWHCWPHEWWQGGGRPRRWRRHLVGISFPPSAVGCPDLVMHRASQSLGKKPTGRPPLTSRWEILSYWRKRKRLTGTKIGNLNWNLWLNVLFSEWERVWDVNESRRALAREGTWSISLPRSWLKGYYWRWKNSFFFVYKEKGTNFKHNNTTFWFACCGLSITLLLTKTMILYSSFYW